MGSASTISFYRVRCDLDRYQFLQPDESKLDPVGFMEYFDRGLAGEPGGRPIFDGRPWDGIWRPPPVRSPYPRLRRGAFWGFSGYGACLGVHPSALEHGHLSVFLHRAGELLPVTYEGQEFSVLNVTECIDALDPEQTIYYDEPEFDEFELAGLDEETVKGLVENEFAPKVDEPRFRLDRLGSQLFKLPETAIRDLYYWERSEDGPDEQFRVYCEREALDGLIFEPIYTTEEP